jgi:hypothetical protein
MTAKPLVYLAGPISGQNLAGALDWRERARCYLLPHQIATLNPLRGKDYLNSIVKDGVYSTSYADHPMSTPHGITMRDRWDAVRCDLLLAYFPPLLTKVSIGTVMEVAWASQAGRYVLAVMEPGEVHDHGMLTDSCSLVLRDLDEALHLIPTILGVG